MMNRKRVFYWGDVYLRRSLITLSQHHFAWAKSNVLWTFGEDTRASGKP